MNSYNIDLMSFTCLTQFMNWPLWSIQLKKVLFFTEFLLNLCSTAEPFSVEGDSGAVVCDDNINTGDVTVISLLCGDLKEEIGNQTRFLYSYTTDIQKVVSELMDMYNCQIEPGK